MASLLHAGCWRVRTSSAFHDSASAQRSLSGRAAVRRAYRTLSVRASSTEPGSSSSGGEAAPEPVVQQQPVRAPASASAEQGTSKGFLAGGAVGLGVALFVAARLAGGAPSFAALEAEALPIDVALSNGKPTMIEFYADYCEVCRELLPQTLAAEQEYRGRINFVALNIENTKWAPEVLEYGVSGIPHFVFLDAQGKPQAAAVGKLPPEVLLGDLDALAEGKPLPYARVRGEVSPMQRPEAAMTGPSSKQAGPLDHF